MYIYISKYRNLFYSLVHYASDITMTQIIHIIIEIDPLSPLLFNLVIDDLVIDELFDSLPKWIGACVNTCCINSLSFADDIILLAETLSGMKELICITEEFYRNRNMKINAMKCFFLHLMTSKKDRALIVAKTPTYKISGDEIEATTYDSTFKYHGIRYDPRGRTTPSLQAFTDILGRVQKSSLKPNQKVIQHQQQLLTCVLMMKLRMKTVNLTLLLQMRN